MRSLLVLIISLLPIYSFAQDAVNFSKKKIKLGNQTVLVEIADTGAGRARGLMFRKELPEGNGMLFIFEEEQPLSFWMKNTLVPLSIGYFDKQKKLLQVVEMTPAIAGEMTPPSYPSKAPAQFALEMPKGWFSRHKIANGTTFTYVK